MSRTLEAGEKTMNKPLLMAAIATLLSTPAFAQAPLTNDKSPSVPDSSEDVDAEKTPERKERHRHDRRGKRHRIKRMDANKDGQISNEEAKGRLAENFDEIDSDADGQLTKEELQAFGKARMLERAEKRFAETDTNQDGQLSKEEVGDRLQLKFDEIDTNADGQLSADELKAFAEKRREELKERRFEAGEDQRKPRKRGPRGRRGGKDDMIKRLDTDKDGQISKDEAQGKLAELFNEIDADADGQLTKEELKMYMEEKRIEQEAE